MEVKTTIFEKVLFKLSRVMLNISFGIDEYIYRKHDSEGVFNSWQRDESDNTIIFRKVEDEEES